MEKKRFFTQDLKCLNVCHLFQRCENIIDNRENTFSSYIKHDLFLKKVT